MKKKRITYRFRKAYKECKGWVWFDAVVKYVNNKPVSFMCLDRKWGNGDHSFKWLPPENDHVGDLSGWKKVSKPISKADLFLLLL